MQVLGRVLELVVSLIEFSLLCVVGILQGVFFIVAGIVMIVEDRLFN